MSLALRLVLAFAAVTVVVFGVVGYAAVRVSGDAVEAGLLRRIESTVEIIRKRETFFLFEAARREPELRQLADISGFEIVVPSPADGSVSGSSLPREAAEEFLRAAPESRRFEVDLGGVGYRGAREKVSGRVIYLLAASAPIARAKAEAARPVLVVSLVGLLATVLAGAVLAGTVTRPLRRLALRVAEVREGRLDVEMPTGGGREVAGLARGFGEMLEGLARYREELVRKEKLATLGRFSAAVAPEIRNPLSSLRMTLQMLRRDAPGAMAEDLDLLLAEMSRLDHSVEELLFHAGTPRYVMAELDLREPARETVRTLQPLAEHLGVTLRLGEPDEGVTVRGDSGKLRQAVMNLVLNALQASGPDQAVDVAVRDDGRGGVVEVADAGPGVPAEISERLFAPFVSGREGGTGLGLSVTQAIGSSTGGSTGERPFACRCRGGRRCRESWSSTTSPASAGRWSATSRTWGTRSGPPRGPRRGFLSPRSTSRTS